FRASGSVFLAALSPLSMSATPTAFGWGGSFLFIHASPQACHSLSRHIGSPEGSTMHIQPLVPARNCFIFPSGPTPITVAPLAISGGAALVAFAIVAASDIGFALCVSLAYAAQLARMRTAVRATTILCMIGPLGSS